MLLCRTDIFELLEGANKNKIRQDSAIDLDWYADRRSPARSLLVRIANLRASLAFGDKTDVFSEFLPTTTFRQPTPKVLLDTTRHTPRDFLQLLKYIQSCCVDREVTTANLRSGIRKYSVGYFLPEIIDELEGYVTAVEAKEFFRLVGILRSRDFSVEQVYSLLDSEPTFLKKENIDVILRALFECSALGNVQRKARGQWFLTFRYRNRHATFNIGERLILHRGLWSALNLRVDPSWENDMLADEEGSVV